MVRTDTLKHLSGRKELREPPCQFTEHIIDGNDNKVNLRLQQRKDNTRCIMYYTSCYGTNDNCLFQSQTMEESDVSHTSGKWIQPYALKVLPITIIWLKLAYEIICKSYIVKTQSANDTTKL